MLYLGTWNSPESKTKYEEILTEWLLQNDRSTQGQIRTDELVLLYLDHTQEYHRKDGELTSEYSCIKSALRFVVQHCARVRVREFGPKLLKEVRDCMIAAEFTRSTINKHVGRIRRMFRWGVENEYVPGSVIEICCL
jgi:hypothetical protein